MPLVPYEVVTVTSTVPPLEDDPAGEFAVRLVAELTTTPVAGLAPKFTVMPLVKPVPVTVTEVPPAMGPLDGLTPVTAGATSYT